MENDRGAALFELHIVDGLIPPPKVRTIEDAFTQCVLPVLRWRCSGAIREGHYNVLLT